MLYFIASIINATKRRTNNSDNKNRSCDTSLYCNPYSILIIHCMTHTSLKKCCLCIAVQSVHICIYTLSIKIAYAVDRALGLSYMTFYHTTFELKTQNQFCLRVKLYRDVLVSRHEGDTLEPSTTSNPHPAGRSCSHISSATPAALLRSSNSIPNFQRRIFRMNVIH